jgi:tetratricopeptide (TPR) repeat protein
MSDRIGVLRAAETLTLHHAGRAGEALEREYNMASLGDSIWRDLLQVSLQIMENGLGSVDATLRPVQSALAQLAGEAPATSSRQAPVMGPADSAAAISELANRLLRRIRASNRTSTSWWWDALEAAYRSLPHDIAWNPRRWVVLPLQLPVSVSTLAAQEGLRALVTLEAVRPELWGDFLNFVVEIFSDLQVYFSLQYGEELERYRRHLQHYPNDARARLECGRTFMKCGLFREAVDTLESSTHDPAVQRQANYESLVAHYRLGDYWRAIRHGIACLEQDLTDERARYWLWLAARKAGGYPAAVRQELRMDVVDGYQPTMLEMEEVAAAIGLDKTSGGRGTAVFDATGDGTLDVVIAGAHAGCSLFRNNGDGTFTDISTGSGLDRCVYAFALAVGDYDNNGLPDLFISGLGFFNGQSILMRNNGDGTFTDVTDAAGLRMWGPAFTATWVDYDGDGYLDLFVVNNLGGLFDRKTPNRLFHNNGDGTFTEVTGAAGLTTMWPSLGAAWGDFRNIGRADLFISNLGRAQLFHNNGNGTFTDVSRTAGIDAPVIGSGCLCCDIDDDGWLDIVQFTYSRPDDAIYTLRTGHGPDGGTPMRVFRNNRDGTFTDIAPQLGLNGCWGTMSGTAGDINNDGRIDFLLGNGDPGMDRTEAAILLENDGRRFHNVTFTAGLPFTGKGHGVNMADLAGDGRLHLIVGAGGLYPGDLLTTAVYRPKRLPGNYLNVRLVGTSGNRDAIGARLRLRAGGREQHRLVSGGSGFGCLPFEQHFGLGAVTQIEWLEIRWPGGHVQRFDQPPSNQSIRIVEGHACWETLYPDRAAAGP